MKPACDLFVSKLFLELSPFVSSLACTVSTLGSHSCHTPNYLILLVCLMLYTKYVILTGMNDFDNEVFLVCCGYTFDI